MVDVPRLRKIVEWVEEQERLPSIERRWHQQAWLTGFDYDSSYSSNPQAIDVGCGTKCCVAGWVALENGAQITLKYGSLSFDGMDPCEYLAQQLGLPVDRARWLTAPDNTAESVRRVAEGLAGERL